MKTRCHGLAHESRVHRWTLLFRLRHETVESGVFVFHMQSAAPDAALSFTGKQRGRATLAGSIGRSGGSSTWRRAVLSRSVQASNPCATVEIPLRHACDMSTDESRQRHRASLSRTRSRIKPQRLSCCLHGLRHDLGRSVCAGSPVLASLFTRALAVAQPPDGRGRGRGHFAVSGDDAFFAQ